MKTITSPRSLHSLTRQASRQGQRVGFVPTMGALHDGHLSLIRQARKENDLVVVSIFVNPTQFGPREDLAAYPRPLACDRALCCQEKADIVFCPSVQTMYPEGSCTTVEVAGLDQVLCGRTRPGHFRGVTTVVSKLLNIVSPDTLYLGQKDFQQCVIIKQMILDQNLFVQVRVCPTVREPDGLAFSSRNQYLTPEERRQAPEIYRALREARAMILSGQSSAQKIRSRVSSTINKRTRGRVDYVEVLSAGTLKPLHSISGEILIACAVFLGRARLIDNLTVKIKNKKS